jgi:hypothetical protein
MPPSSSNTAATSRSASKRLIKELETWSREQKEEKGIERLGPVSEGDLMEWEAVINGRGIGQGYDGLSLTYLLIVAFANIPPKKDAGSSISPSHRRTLSRRQR